MISGSSSAGEAAFPRSSPIAVEAGPVLDIGTVAAASVGALAALVRFGPSSRALVAACFLAALGVLAVIDLRINLIPNRIVLPAAALVLALQLVLFPADAVEWLVSAAGCFALLLVLALAKPGGLGMGDVKLGLLLGAGLGSDVAVAMLVGFLALWPFALWILLQDGASEGGKRTLPLGPALAFGAAVVLLGA